MRLFVQNVLGIHQERGCGRVEKDRKLCLSLKPAILKMMFQGGLFQGAGA